MPPSAAPEWLRVGWIFEISATSAPASWASIAARMPAHPAPTTSTSCFASTALEATRTAADAAAVAAAPYMYSEGGFPSRPGRGRSRSMTDLGPRLRLNQELDHVEPPTALFLARLLDAALPEIRSDHWATSARSLADVGAPLMRSTPEGMEDVVLELDGALVHVALHGGYVSARAAAQDERAALGAIEALHERPPAPEPVARHDVPVAFWTYTPNGPMPSLRPIAVPEWSEIRDNYTAETRERLEAIMHRFRPAHRGQLILWHGTAGSGKTFALRALA